MGLIDLLLVQEARQYAGADIHDVEKSLCFYTRTADDAMDYDPGIVPYVGRNRHKIFALQEVWLREFVIRKKLEKH